jgi:hypothetical protein
LFTVTGLQRHLPLKRHTKAPGATS